jgi:hypothetical protein
VVNATDPYSSIFDFSRPDLNLSQLNYVIIIYNLHGRIDNVGRVAEEEGISLIS